MSRAFGDLSFSFFSFPLREAVEPSFGREQDLVFNRCTFSIHSSFTQSVYTPISNRPNRRPGSAIFYFNAVVLIILYAAGRSQSVALDSPSLSLGPLFQAIILSP